MYVITKLVWHNRYFFNRNFNRWEGLIDNATIYHSFPDMAPEYQRFMLLEQGDSYEYIQIPKKKK